MNNQNVQKGNPQGGEITSDDLLKIIGAKEVQITAARDVVNELQNHLKRQQEKAAEYKTKMKKMETEIEKMTAENEKLRKGYDDLKERGIAAAVGKKDRFEDAVPGVTKI